MAQTLSDQQRNQGLESRLISVLQSDLRQSPLSSPLHTLAAGVDEYLIKNGSFSSPISLARDLVPGISPASLSDARVLHLHGINGAIALRNVSKVQSSPRIIWTLHDMNPFTGACHYSLDCAGFTRSCTQCPAVRKPFHASVEQRLKRKMESLQKTGPVSLVAPSEWLAQAARESTMFREQEITVIKNPISPVFFEDQPGGNSPSMDNPSLRLIVVARNLSDPVKNVGLAVSVFARLREKFGDAHLTLVGNGGREFQGPGIRLTGAIDSSRLAIELRQSDAIIVPSKADNAPLVIGEAAASGCSPLVASSGGMRAMVGDFEDGVAFTSPVDLEQQLNILALRDPGDRAETRKKLMVRAEELYSPFAAVREYSKVYEGDHSS